MIMSILKQLEELVMANHADALIIFDRTNISNEEKKQFIEERYEQNLGMYILARVCCDFSEEEVAFFNEVQKDLEKLKESLDN
jgi:hypothetical protein